MTTIKRIAVLTSGGDAPGMNAAIRAVTRTALVKGWEVFGVIGGYRGLMQNEFRQLDMLSVAGIIQLGGTVLGSARAPEFKEVAGREKALGHLAAQGIDALVVIGGNGSQAGANALHEMGFSVVGVASTIDNDLVGSDITIGVDTALNIAMEAVDRLKTTAVSHRRAFLVEVMGRDSGYLALMTGLAAGAVSIVIPERELSPEQVSAQLVEAYDNGKAHGLVVVAEGCSRDAQTLADTLKDMEPQPGYPVRVTKLGHVQRGGIPVASDRLLATRLGAAATEQLAAGNSGVLVGRIRGEIMTTPLPEVVGNHKPLDLSLLELAYILADPTPDTPTILG